MKSLRFDTESAQERRDTTGKRKRDYMTIDSSALEHVVADIDLFYSVKDVAKLEAKLANSSTVKSRHK